MWLKPSRAQHPKCWTWGTSHALALQPENLEEEFSVEPEIPEGAFTTTATLREFIDAYNASIPRC